MDASEMVARKTELTDELARLNKALAMLGDSTRAIMVSTHKNLRNTNLCVEGPGGSDWRRVPVYANKEMTVKAPSGDHAGYITAADAATLRAENTDENLWDWGVHLED